MKQNRDIGVGELPECLPVTGKGEMKILNYFESVLHE